MVRASVRGRDGFVVVRATGARSGRRGGLGAHWRIYRGDSAGQAVWGTRTETSVRVPVTRERASRAFNAIVIKLLSFRTGVSRWGICSSPGSTAAGGKQQIPRCASE